LFKELAKTYEIDNWDLTCFCVEYLGSQVSVHPWLMEDVKRLNKLVYTAHYMVKENG
jgi:hypothetical protein